MGGAAEKTNALHGGAPRFLWKPSASTDSPSPPTITQPTHGFGAVERRPRSASRNAWSIQLSCVSACENAATKRSIDGATGRVIMIYLRGLLLRRSRVGASLSESRRGVNHSQRGLWWVCSIRSSIPLRAASAIAGGRASSPPGD